ncbi:MAG: DUF308 domain-containing protein [Campylobacterales bacterium]|nr:DUF308 domain-containing protein [Campylobacterales bacterium]
MWKYPSENNLFEKFGNYARITGLIFVALGLVGIFYPVFMTLATVTFVAWLMLLAGLIAGSFTYYSNKGDVMGWIKSFILIIISLFLLYYPAGGAATVGLLLSIYFFIDGFTSVWLALFIRPDKLWIIWIINAIFSFIMGAIFIFGWPFTSSYLVGLLVGFSLFFDGIALLIGSSIFTKMMR